MRFPNKRRAVDLNRAAVRSKERQMKRCPNCQRTYPDDAPNFCVNDGTQLIPEEAPGFDPQKTILASAPQPPPPPYSNPAPPLANQPPPQQAPWPPPPPHQQQQQQPQAQNWGGGYYPQPGQQPYAAPPYARPVGKGNKLSIAALVFGCISGLLGFLLFAGFQGWMRIFDRDTAYAAIIAAVITGAISLVVGALALISARQRNKALAVIGMVMSAATIAFYIYLETEYGILF
jgi:hypothetical protein